MGREVPLPTILEFAQSRQIIVVTFAGYFRSGYQQPEAMLEYSSLGDMDFT